KQVVGPYYRFPHTLTGEGRCRQRPHRNYKAGNWYQQHTRHAALVHLRGRVPAGDESKHYPSNNNTQIVPAAESLPRGDVVTTNSQTVDTAVKHHVHHTDGSRRNISAHTKLSIDRRCQQSKHHPS
ncbi:unnamed protein product, partial [Ectocarpus fasciculatus]